MLSPDQRAELIDSYKRARTRDAPAAAVRDRLDTTAGAARAAVAALAALRPADLEHAGIDAADVESAMPLLDRIATNAGPAARHICSRHFAQPNEFPHATRNTSAM